MDKIQVKLYLSRELAEALRVAAARRGGTGAMSAIAEELLRNGLGMQTKKEARTMTYAEAIRQLAHEGYENVDYGDGWVDILDHLNSLEPVAYEIKVAIGPDPNREGVLEIVAFDERGYLRSEPLAWVKR